jgi:hypothetical protein
LREKRDQASTKEGAWRSHPLIRVGTFTIGVFSVLALVALFIPRAQVRLHPQSKVQSLVLPVTASPSVSSVFITGSIPAREQRVIVDGTKTIAVTGEGVIPQSKAKGQVIFRNLTQQAVMVPAGTVVRTADAEAVRFVTTRAGEVEAGIGKLTELPIEAVDGGLSGNVEAETVLVVEGRLGLSLSVTNPEVLKGGREIPSVQASEADHERVKEQLLKDMQEDARALLVDEIETGDLLFEDTLDVAQVLLEEYDPPPGAASPKLTLTMQVEFSMLYVAASDLTELAALALNASLPSGYSAESQALSVEPVTEPTINDDGSAHWTVRAERRIVQQINNAWVMQLIQGVRSERAPALLKQHLQLEDAPEVELSPSWWPWVPIVPFRISVVTE